MNTGFLKALVIGLGVLIVVSLAAVVWAIAQKAGSAKMGVYAQSVNAPVDAEVLLEGEYLMVRHAGRVQILRAADGRLVGTIELCPEGVCVQP